VTPGSSSVCLIDGTYELYRAFFSAPARSHHGREVGAVVGLVRSLGSLKNSGQFTHYAVAFDTVIESFRNELFDGYKTGEGVPPELYQQFPLAEEATRALGLVVLSMIEFEADDGLASAAHVFEQSPSCERITIASPDKDLMQCVRGTHVVTWDRSRKRTYGEAEVLEKLGVLPLSIPDYLALVGDTADGIPGVPRWGAKSAGVVLQRYQHLENIPRSVEELDVSVRGARELLASLAEYENEVLLFRTLATLRRDAPVPLEIEAYSPVASDSAWLERLLGPGAARPLTPF
jgi:5'-3' exonuclease